MKTYKVTIPFSDLNSLPYVEVDLTYSHIDDFTYYPTAVQYINSNITTSATLGFLYLTEDEKNKEVDANPNYFQYLQIPYGISTADMPATKFLRIKLTSGTATSDLIVYVYNYVAWEA